MKYLNFLRKLTIIVLLFGVKNIAFAQSELKLGENSGTKNNSAVLEIESTKKGLLIPRMTTVQMNAIVTPVTGLMIYNTDLNCIHYYFGGWKSQCDPGNLGAWALLGNTGTNAATNFLGTTDNIGLSFRTNNILRASLSSGGNFGIGIATPTYKLDVQGTNPLRLNGLVNGAATDSVLTSSGGIVRRLSASALTQANAWGLLGNAGTNTTTNFLGTTDNVGLILRTNNAIRQTITANGKVGFGILAPTSAFHVAGNQSVIAEQPARFDNIITGSGAPVNGLWDWSGHFTNTTVSPTAASGNWYSGSYNLLRSSSSNLNSSSILVATASDAKYDGTATIAGLAGTNPFAQNTSTGTVTSAIGSENAVGNTAGGTITSAIGARGWIFNSSTGTINDARGVLARVQNTGAGSINKSYGLYVEPLAGSKRWGVYQEGLNDYNYFKGRTAIGSFSEKPDTSAVFPGFKTGNLLAVQGEFTNAEYTAGGAFQGIMVGVQPNPTSAVNGITAFRAINAQITVPSGNTQIIPQLRGVSSDVSTRGTGAVGTAMGFSTGVYTSVPGSSITDALGIFSNVTATASSTINNAYALKATVKNTSGTINTGYGLHIEDIQATNDFGVYQEGADDTNYFAGNTGIGTTAPTYKLDVQGTNPLRLNGLVAGALTDSILTSNAGVVRRISVSQLTGATTNTLGLTGNTLTSTVNGIAATSNAVSSVANTSTANTLLTTINGVAGTGVNIINTNTTSLSGTNLTTTVNGVASTALDLSPAVNSTAWRLLGNSGTVASTNFIGTTDNVALVTRTNNVERMRVTETGNVGVATATPTSTMQVAGSFATAIRSVSATAAATITTADCTILVDCTTAAIAMTLPAATTCSGRTYTIKKLDAANALSFNLPLILDLSQSLSSTTMATTLTIQSDGTSWYIVNRF